MSFARLFKGTKYPRSFEQTHSFEINGSSRNNIAGRDNDTPQRSICGFTVVSEGYRIAF
ncbi:hypothetical protein M422DRAFT_785916 [Sphaerobolus stellatus SS14]|uniref:Uncharacterized protein n=1 Tax=Sphaerobolus stellatus (strain SS14) TaxID=990650 RepID=A0A0C9UFL2_SPHS4|nr:hypothetical protein M422DRAFT_785916 [Sphaerobolus stellatus SS14]